LKRSCPRASTRFPALCQNGCLRICLNKKDRVLAAFAYLCASQMKIRKKSVIKAVKAVDRQLEIEKFGKLISTRPTRVAKSKKKYDRKSAKRQFRQVLGRNMG